MSVGVSALIFATDWLAKTPEPDSMMQTEFAATESAFAFLQAGADKIQQLVLFRDRSSEVFTFSMQEERIWSLSVGKVTGSFYVSASPNITIKEFRSGRPFLSSLYRCKEYTSCDLVFQHSGIIGSVVELSAEQLVFVSGTLTVRADPTAPSLEFVAPASFDLHKRDEHGKISVLTNWDAVELKSLSVGSEVLAFRMTPSLSRAPQQSQYPWRASKIFALEMTKSGEVGNFDQASAEPYVYDGMRLNIEPYISHNARNIAFLSASESSSSKWVYSIAIISLSPRKLLRYIKPEIDSIISKPIFIADDRIRYMSFDGSDFRFFESPVEVDVNYLKGQVSLSSIKNKTHFTAQPR